MTPASRAVVVATPLLGLLAAAAGPAALPPDGRTFAGYAALVQSLMSVGVPFLGALLMRDVRRGTRTLRRGWGVAFGYAAAVGVFGGVVCAVAAAQVGRGAAIVAAGGVLVQVLAQAVGTGMGLLIDRPVVACLATIVVPLGAYLVLSRVGGADWLTPYAVATRLLAGDAGAIVRWVVVALLWGGALNAAGLARRAA